MKKLFALISAFLMLLAFVSSALSAGLLGDADGDGDIDLNDINLVTDLLGTQNNAADFNSNSVVDIFDYNTSVIAFRNSKITPLPTIKPTATPLGSPTPFPTLPPTSSNGIWISPQELMALPTSGSAWTSLVSKANSNWGTPNLSDYAGLTHSQGVYAGALVAVRTGDSALRTKTINALNAVIGTEQAALPASGGGKDDGSLAIVRQFPRYVLAAELLGITDWSDGYKGHNNFVDYMRSTKFTFRKGDGGRTFASDHDSCASNGNSMSGGARVISAAYLKDTAELNRAWLTFRRYTGDTTVGPNICINDAGLTWFYAPSSSPHMGINPKGAKCNGKNYPADGVIPADQGRGGNCPSDPNSAPGYTQYPWDGLQGIYAQAEVFYRLGYKDPSGKNPYQVNDNALLRAVEYQWYLQNKFGGEWYDSNRAAWVKHLAFKRYGYKPTNYDAIDGARNVGYTQWTHQ